MKEKIPGVYRQKKKDDEERTTQGSTAEGAWTGRSTCAVAILRLPSRANIQQQSACTSCCMTQDGIWLEKKPDAKPEAHSAALDGVIDSTDDGRDACSA